MTINMTEQQLMMMIIIIIGAKRRLGRGTEDEELQAIGQLERMFHLFSSPLLPLAKRNTKSNLFLAVF